MNPGDSLAPWRPSPVLQGASVVYIFCIPLDAIRVDLGRSVTFVAGVVLVAIWMLERLPRSPSFRGTASGAAGSSGALTWVAVVFATWLTWRLVSSLWASDDERAVTSLLAFALLALVTVALVDGMRTGSTLHPVAFVGAAAILAIATLTSSGSPGAVQRTAWALNENSNAMILAVGATWSLLLASTLGKRWAAVLFTGTAILIAAAAVSTGSRSGLLGLGLGCAYVAWRCVRMSSRRFRTAVAVSALLALTVVVALKLLPVLSPRLSGGLLSPNGLADEKRLQIWNAILSRVDDWLLIGAGPGSTVGVTRDVLGQGFVAHNTWLSIWVETGLVGVLLSVAALITVLVVASSSRYRDFVFGGLLTLLPFSFLLTIEDERVLWLILAMSMTRRLPHAAGVGPTDAPGARTRTRRVEVAHG